MNYYYVELLYENKRKNPKGIAVKRTGHVIKARDVRDCIRILKKHKIAYPMGSTDISDFFIESPLPDYLIERRQKGIGGSIWMENEKGELCKEEK